MKLNTGKFMNGTYLDKIRYNVSDYVCHKYSIVNNSKLIECVEVYKITSIRYNNLGSNPHKIVGISLDTFKAIELDENTIIPLWIQAGDEFYFDGGKYIVDEVFCNSHKAFSVRTTMGITFGLNLNIDYGYIDNFELLW